MKMYVTSAGNQSSDSCLKRKIQTQTHTCYFGWFKVSFSNAIVNVTYTTPNTLMEEICFAVGPWQPCLKPEAVCLQIFEILSHKTMDELKWFILNRLVTGFIKTISEFDRSLLNKQIFSVKTCSFLHNAHKSYVN